VPSPAAGNVLANLLSQEVEAVRSFILLLRREQSLLAEGASETLTALAEEKSRGAGQLTSLAEAREAQLAALKLPAGRAGMDAWTTSADGTSSRDNWNQLLQLAVEARALNEANGKLIGVHLQHCQQGINVLTAALDQAATYGPDGQQRTGISGRSRGSI
jgi:flagellar biosynthesis protein FlgN